MSSNTSPLVSILEDLNQTKGVEGSLLVDSGGVVVVNLLEEKNDKAVLGPMTHIINNSSQKLLNSAYLGNMDQVLLESKKGRILFISIQKIHLIILIGNNAHLGMVLRAANQASRKIDNYLKKSSKLGYEAAKKIEPPKNEFKTVHLKDSNDTHLRSDQREIEKGEKSFINQSPSPSTTKIASTPKNLPPPAYSAPETLVPKEPEKRAEMILDIYEAIFLAMAHGASKIMGVSPARGLLKQFLPYQKCKELLVEVEVKDNGSLDFNRIRQNAWEIPLEEREQILIEYFNHVLRVITDNYGRIMGYDAFRGMIKPEFRIIGDSFRGIMKELKMMEQLHPEIQKLVE